MKTSPKRLIVIAVIAVSLIPVKSITVPTWTVQFVDAKGRPFANLPVRQTWQNYSVEESAHYEAATTDNIGNVTFPERTLWVPVFFRIVGPACSVARTGIHASFGPSSWIVAQCDLLVQGKKSDAYFGEDLPSTIQLGYFDRAGIRKALPGAMEPPPQCPAIEQQARDAGA